MSKFLKTLLVATLAIGFAGAVQASEPPKTLPAPVYGQMKSGKKLDKVFLDPAYDRTKGFTFDGPVDWQADNRDSQMADLLASQFKGLGKAGAPLTLKLAVTNLTEKHATGFGYIKPKLTLEGQLVDEQGKVVAAFVHTEKVPLTFSGPDDRACVDAIVGDFLKDLVR